MLFDFGYTIGLTLAARLCTINGDTIVATADAVVESTNKPGRYAAEFEGFDDVGDYCLIVGIVDEDEQTVWGVSSEFYSVAADDIRVVPWSEERNASSSQIASIVAAVVPDAGELATSVANQLSALSLRRLDSANRLATDITVVRGTTWRIPLTVDALPSDWTRIEFTARKGSESQAASLLHIVLSAPGTESDGLKILRASQASDPSQGQITVLDDQAIATVVAAAVADVTDDEYCWDAKITTADGVDQINRGTLFVEKDVTRLVA
jgi:hypothetical protein